MSKRIFTFTVSLPLAARSRGGARAAITSTGQLEVLRKSSHEPVTHSAQSGEVGDILVGDSTAGQHRIIASEDNVLLD